MNSQIILTTLNAKYAHTAIGLRYLYANLKELKSSAAIQEYIISDNLNEVAEKIISSFPSILGISVYIWNAVETSQLINIIKKVAPEITIILGGPEVSYLPMRVDFSSADYIIQGEGEDSFCSLCKSVLTRELPSEKIIKSEPVDLKKIELPYDFYTDEDVLHRVIYVEASRGCPFSCEFCLSAIDKTVREFDLDLVLSHVSKLWERGVRKFKFVDRTFNLNINTADRILDYFLEKQSPYFIHFEVIPEHFPESLKEKIKQFPPAAIQLEIGIQTLKPKTAETIKRKLDFEKIKENLFFLQNQTNAHLHVDLILGLPGETIEDFGDNLNILTALSDSEIQLGILKKLSGTAISRHDEEYGMVYSDLPPYEILQNNLIPFELMQKMKRFVRFWDLVYNSGNFNKTARLLWAEGNVFECFHAFSEWVYTETDATWKISLNRLAKLIFKYLVEIKKKDKTAIADMIVRDLLIVKGRRIPGFLRDQISFVPESSKKDAVKMYHRQIKHSVKD
ncbi:MAG: DUF4080 domain-containing protein [PVC group bacterium]|nr:DUF4080 domain-containing protein [PVC group bacterium]